MSNGALLLRDTVNVTRMFKDRQGRELELSVLVARGVDRGPVTVASRIAMPTGRQYRYRQHVSVWMVAEAVERWMDTLPETYCSDAGCADMRAEQWDRLCKNFLAHVECLEVEA